MNLLGAKLYDPGTAATKATSSLLAMTAFDTTNLRLTVTVPAHGMVRFKMRCQITGATTAPTVFLGVLNGATVVGRVVPLYENATANATSQNFALDAEFTATGLTPGSTSFDAAYAVQVVVASTNIKYGGPNNNSGANAWGAFLFEAWDPQPLTLALDGGVNLKQILGTNVSTPATAGILDVNVKNIDNDAASASGTVTFPNATLASTTNITAAAGCAVSSIGANVITATSINADAITDAKVASDVTIASVTGAVGSVTGAVGSVTGNVGGNVTGSVGSIATGGITTGSFAAGAINAAAIATDAIGAAEIAADAITEIQSGLATAANLAIVGGYIDTEVAAIKAKTDNLPASPANEATLTTIAGYIDTEVAAIKAKTDQLTFTTANTIDARAFTVDDKTG